MQKGMDANDLPQANGRNTDETSIDHASNDYFKFTMFHPSPPESLASFSFVFDVTH